MLSLPCSSPPQLASLLTDGKQSSSSSCSISVHDTQDKLAQVIHTMSMGDNIMKITNTCAFLRSEC